MVRMRRVRPFMAGSVFRTRFSTSWPSCTGSAHMRGRAGLDVEHDCGREVGRLAQRQIHALADDHGKIDALRHDLAIGDEVAQPAHEFRRAR